jgi:hypothetical protein
MALMAVLANAFLADSALVAAVQNDEFQFMGCISGLVFSCGVIGPLFVPLAVFLTPIVVIPLCHFRWKHFDEILPFRDS